MNIGTPPPFFLDSKTILRIDAFQRIFSFLVFLSFENGLPLSVVNVSDEFRFLPHRKILSFCTFCRVKFLSSYSFRIQGWLCVVVDIWNPKSWNPKELVLHPLTFSKFGNCDVMWLNFETPKPRKTKSQNVFQCSFLSRNFGICLCLMFGFWSRGIANPEILKCSTHFYFFLFQRLCDIWTLALVKFRTLKPRNTGLSFLLFRISEVFSCCCWTLELAKSRTLKPQIMDPTFPWFLILEVYIYWCLDSVLTKTRTLKSRSVSIFLWFRELLCANVACCTWEIMKSEFPKYWSPFIFSKVVVC